MSSTAQQARAVLARFAAAARAGTAAALDAEMARLAAATKGRMAKDTGDLADSTRPIAAVAEGSVVRAGVAVASGHAAAQEFGTAHNPAHPSLRPSITESQARTPGAIAAAIRQHPT